MKSTIKNFIKKIFDSYGFDIINKNQKIVELSVKDNELINLIKDYSMTPKIRIYNLLQSLKKIKHKNIPGDYVECGVWKGGNILLIKKFLENENIDNKKIYAFDTFEGMSEPDENDFDLSKNISASALLSKNKDKASHLWSVCSLEEVKKNLIKNLKNMNDIYFIKGKVEETLNVKQNIPDKISLLRLDTDWYSSTKKELEVLYEKVSPGGVIIIDDYGHWGGAKKAVDEFFKGKYVWMHYVDYACRLIIKE
jgi:O-methyltransferase